MPELMNLKEVAEYFRCSEVTLWRRLKERRAGVGNFPLPITPPGKKMFWRRFDVESWDANADFTGCDSENRPTTPAQREAKKRQMQRRFAELGVRWK